MNRWNHNRFHFLYISFDHLINSGNNMANIVNEVKLIMTDMDANNNKYWYAAVMDDGTYVQENGRVGAANPQRRTKNLGVSGAQRELDKKVAEKLGKGYEHARVLGGSQRSGRIAQPNRNQSISHADDR